MNPWLALAVIGTLLAVGVLYALGAAVIRVLLTADGAEDDR